MIKAIIFDMDGVIVDSLPMHLKIWEKIFTRRGLEFNLKIYERYNGLSTVETAENMKKDFDMDDDPEDIVKEKIRLEKEVRESIALFDNAVETLECAKKKGYKLALGTSAMSHMLDYILEKFDIGKYFDAIVSAREVEHTKPSPEIFILAAERLGVEPKECAVVEDAINGVLAAKKAGMCTIAMTTTSKETTLKKEHPDFTVSSLKELKEMIEGEKLCAE